MDCLNLVDAVMRALGNCDTEGIKHYLMEDCYADCIFHSQTSSRVGLSTWALFREVKTPIVENLFRWPFNYHDALGNTLLHLAASISDYDLTRLLLEKGADVTSVDKFGRTALHIASDKNSLEIIKLLTEKSPPYILDLPDIMKDTPLYKACRCNCPDVVQFLLSQGSSVRVKDFQLDGPLLNAASNIAKYATPIASLLLDAGADINHASNIWGTTLIFAARKSASKIPPSANSTTNRNYSYLDLCMLLIERGCDVNAADCEGQTALHVAVITEQESLIQKLLIYGTDIDRRDMKGLTPLYYASKNGSQKIVDLLIICGANLRAHDWQSLLTTVERFLEEDMTEELPIAYEKYAQLLRYIICKSNQCLALEILCLIAIRKRIRNVEENATELGLPALLLRRLQLKD